MSIPDVLQVPWGTAESQRQGKVTEMPNVCVPCCLTSSLVVLAAASPVEAQVTGRYVRYEAPMSLHMHVGEIEVYRDGKNIAPEHRDGLSIIWADDGQIPASHYNGGRGGYSPDKDTGTGEVLTDGVVGKTWHRGIVQINGSSFYHSGTSPFKQGVINPVLELDLGGTVAIEKIVVTRHPYNRDEYQDKHWRLIVVLDGERKVVASSEFKINDAAYKGGVMAFVPQPGRGTVVGQTVPKGAQQWVSPADVMGAPAPPELSAAQRRQLDTFRERNSPTRIAALGTAFFARMDLSSPELAEIRKLYEADRPQRALDAWRQRFFERVKCMAGVWVYRSPERTYARQADDMLANILVNIGHGSLVTARRFHPGAMRWTGDPELVWINKPQKPLLQAYRRTGERRYLEKWAEITDDWALHYSAQADASPKNERNLFVMHQFDWLNLFFKDLNEIAGARPEVVSDLPSATLARALIMVLEEYPPAYWRVARQCGFNHLFNGWGQTVLPGQILADFHAGRRLARENRQHFERLWGSAGTTRDGSMIEIGDRGHMAMPLASMGQFIALRDLKYPWFTRLHEALYRDGVMNLARFHVRQLAPGEDNFAWVWNVLKESGAMYSSDKSDGLRDMDRIPGLLTASVLDEPDVRAILRPSTGLSKYAVDRLSDHARRQYERVMKRLREDAPAEPSVRSDWMPYAGLAFLRRGWEKDDSFLYMRGQSMAGPTTWPSAHTFFLYIDYGQNLMSASPITVDGKSQDIFHGSQRLYPGSKTDAISAAPEKPINTRWHSSLRFDVAESYYEGAYHTRRREGQPWFDGKPARLITEGEPVLSVQATRQVVQIRSARAFVVTDRIKRQDEGAAGEYRIDYKFNVVQLKGQPFDEGQLAVGGSEEGAVEFENPVRCIRLQNPGAPGLTLTQFGPADLKYERPKSKENAAPPDTRGGLKHWATPFLTVEGSFNATRTLSASWRGKGDQLMVSLLVPHPNPESQRLGEIEDRNSLTAVGFHAVMADGTEISYQAARGAAAELRAGSVKATAEALLVVGDTGIVLGCRVFQDKPAPTPDFEFAINRQSSIVNHQSVRRPIDPVTFGPDDNTFVGFTQVTMTSATPNVDIYYTLDTSDPAPGRPGTLRYTKPISIDKDARIKARAFRRGVTEVPFTTAGIMVSAPSYGWFYRRDFRPAVNVPGDQLHQGLTYEYVEDNWFRLFSHLNVPAVMPAKKKGTVSRLLDVSMRATDGPFGVRYNGYLSVPADGMYTFYGPAEYVDHLCEPGYDLRLCVDGQEWYLGQMWHGRGKWSVPLRKGLHTFAVTFADARAKDINNQKRNLWNNYPEPWAVWRGAAPTIEMSGPSIERQPVPAAWLLQSSQGSSLTEKQEELSAPEE